LAPTILSSVNLQSFLCSISDFAKERCHCCISARLACLESTECWLAGWLADWLAGVFMKQLACHLHWDCHSTRFQCQFIPQLPIDRPPCMLSVLVFFGHAIFTTFSPTSFSLFYQLILCLDSF
jgi:hypothetical protein